MLSKSAHHVWLLLLLLLLLALSVESRRVEPWDLLLILHTVETLSNILSAASHLSSVLGSTAECIHTVRPSHVELLLLLLHSHGVRVEATDIRDKACRLLLVSLSEVARWETILATALLPELV